ncbi:hypothetical protein BGX28_002501 [Mortierella sp. GBA30]|nr:hypothetical protein BGX28_002501 [Mortierella sp. GBA30]
MPRPILPLHRPSLLSKPGHHWNASILKHIFTPPANLNPPYYPALLCHATSLSHARSLAPQNEHAPPSKVSSTSFASEPEFTTPSTRLILRIHSAGKKRNSSAWSPEDDSRLLALRRQGQSWQQIGKTLGRSRQACNRRFDSVVDPENGQSFWIRHPEMSKVLETLVSKQHGWNEIAEHMGIKASSCEKRWREMKQQQEQRRQIYQTLGDEVCAAQDNMSPAAVQRQFRNTDAERLKSAVGEYGLDQWDVIARTVFGSRYSVRQLRFQYTKLERKRQVWTLQQEEELLRVVADRLPTCNYPLALDSKHRVSKVEPLSNDQWDAVAETVLGEHTGEECRKRWLKLQLSGSKQIGINRGHDLDQEHQRQLIKATTGALEGKRGMWTAEQSLRLESIIQDIKGARLTTGTTSLIDWEIVSERMDRAFSKAQCKSRWTRMSKQNALSKAGAWDSQELDQLFSGLLEVGPAWTYIHRNWLPGRSPTFIQGKWSQIMSRMNQDRSSMV